MSAEQKQVVVVDESVALQKQDTVTAALVAREVQEVQAMVLMARKFPRDLEVVEQRVLKACSNLKLAEKAAFSYPRGKEIVEGPSIRLAEAIAQAYENMNFGTRELSTEAGVTTVEAFAWDLERNVRKINVFHVKHERRTKTSTTILEDPRDIYENNANMGARRLRECILRLVPKTLVDAAMEQCRRTLAKGDGRSLSERITRMTTFWEKIGVTTAMLEAHLKHKLEATTAEELAELQLTYNAIVDGFSKIHEVFPGVKAPATGAAAYLNSKFVTKPDAEQATGQ